MQLKNNTKIFKYSKLLYFYCISDTLKEKLTLPLIMAFKVPLKEREKMKLTN